MGLRGRRAKPAQEHKRTGTGRKKQLDERHEVLEIAMTADMLTPKMPWWLSDDAEVVWREIVPLLISAKIVNALHSELLGDYCTATAQKRELGTFLEDNGRFIENANNTKSTRPEVKQYAEAEKRVHKLGELLGLSPKAMKAMNIQIKHEDKSAAAQKKASILKGRK